MLNALEIQVKGIVQGVGFRPFVYRQAKRYLISGWVLNAADGVFIHAEGEEDLVDEFVLALANEAPAAAKVEEINLNEVPLEMCKGFEIRFSDDSEVQETTLVSPDLATCADCARELFDENDRRYRYPFINCTNCGPRFTIIGELPYDRPRTAMASFTMCKDCQTEYDDPENRRFHAQPDACFDCGPHLTWRRTGSSETLMGQTRETSDEILRQAVQLLCEGGIVAVKGLGGYHLACDAQNAEAVALLRSRKHRNDKAFAVMMNDVDTVRTFCQVNREEESILTGPVRPIVLLKKRAGAQFTPGIADRLGEVGVMLPYTPLQHLLMHDFVAAGKTMLVMTSGNFHDEPIVTEELKDAGKLERIADAILGNDRPIWSRYDDSVVRVLQWDDAETDESYGLQMIRRARGFAPMPLKVPTCLQQADAPALFAAGPEQKNTFAILRGGEAFVSQHIGDVENAETFDAWLESKQRFEKLFEITPEIMVCDAHPEYLSTKWVKEQAGCTPVEVQHHHAHIASAMAEHDIEGPVCGIAFDGTGYGADKHLWGGEVLLCNLSDYERFANMAYVPMPGGVAAIKNPLRMAYGVLWEYDLLEHPQAQVALSSLGDATDVLENMIEKGINTPMTSSVGRLFDAAAALLGVCTAPTYEGQPAIELEAAMYVPDDAAAADESGQAEFVEAESAETESGQAESAEAESGQAESVETESAESIRKRYAIQLVKNVAQQSSTAHDTSVVLFDAAPTFRALLDDAQAGVPVADISRRFHDAFVQAIVQIAQVVESVYGITTVVLSGGVFMNRYLMEHAVPALREAGYTVVVNAELPPNDGCISYGQAIVARASL